MAPTPTRLRERVQRAAVVRGHRALRRASGARLRTPRGVALTFDDGPVPGSTERVLDVLAAHGVVATFFCVGRNAERSPELVRRIVEEGHALGSHSLTHPHPARLSPRAVRAEYVRGREAVEQALGAAVPLFRPPHGHLSVRTSRTLRASRPWLWTVDPQDWVPGCSAEQVLSVAGRAGEGDVVLLHDWVEQPVAPAALDRSATIAALPAVIAAVRGRDLPFVRLEP